MANYTEESLEKLLKKNIINIVLSLQTAKECNAKILEEVRALDEKFTTLESQLLITKNVNSLLQERVIDLERQCWANAQYSRRECLEVSGIPYIIKQDELENKVLTIFKKVGCDIKNENIEACHRVRRQNNVIIKFSKWKDRQQVYSVKKDLGKLDMKEVDLPEGTQVYINQSLCPYYKSLWSKSKKLCTLGKIHSFFISNSTIKLKLQENSVPVAITHNSDFQKCFPDVDLSPPN